MLEMSWGEMPYFCGPFHYYKETLILDQIKRYFGKYRGKILDAGCGSGTLSVKLAKLGFLVNAVDLSEKFLKFTKERARLLGLQKQIVVLRDDISNSALPDGSFDGVCCDDVLEHLENDQEAVFEFFRVLKQRGVCVVTVPAHRSLWSVIDKWAGHKKRYEKEKLEKLFSNAGFVIKESFFYGGFVSRFWWEHVYSKIVLKGKNQKLRRSHVLLETIPRVFFQNERLLRIVSLPFKIDNLFKSERGRDLVLVGVKP